MAAGGEKAEPLHRLEFLVRAAIRGAQAVGEQAYVIGHAIGERGIGILGRQVPQAQAGLRHDEMFHETLHNGFRHRGGRTGGA